jgi:hypothetical protein
MTLKESVLKSLEDIKEITNYAAVVTNIIEKKYYDFGQAKTPPDFRITNVKSDIT